VRLLTFTLILASSLVAADFSTRYDVNVGMFVKVGYADVTLEENATHYDMRLVAKTTGTAAALTSNRVETYISKGQHKAGRYIPDSFVKIKKTDREERIQSYTFDHHKKKIVLTEEKNTLVSGTQFDTATFKLVKVEEEEHSTDTSTLPTYNEDDLLSAYLNTKQSCNAQQKEHTLFAVGAHNDKKDITLSFLDGLQKRKAEADFSDDSENIYNLHVKPIGKEDESIDVLIAFDNDGHMKEAFLGDVFWIGEIKAQRVYHRLSSR
jgi:uncharacterized protein DUF3108